MYILFICKTKELILKINIVKYSQYYTITTVSFDRLLYLLKQFNRPYITMKQVRNRGKIHYEEDKRYFVIDNRLTLIRYPISTLDKMISYLQSSGIYDIDISNTNPPKGKNIKVNTTYKFTLKKYQTEYNEYLEISSLPTALLALPTGYGKTVTVLTTLSRFKKRFGIFVLPRYISKWVDDVLAYTDIDEKDIYIVDSGKALNKLMFYNKKEMGHIKVIIFSLKTMQVYLKNWLKDYEEFKYNLEPDELTAFINLGYIINDETHQDFHNVFSTQLFFNTNMFIGITATLEHNDDKISSMYDILFPQELRAKIHIPINRYITAISIKYFFSNLQRLRWQGPFGYNHSILESTILKNKKILNSYLEMIYRISASGYLKDRTDGDKLVVFMNKVDMCVELIKYIRNADAFKNLKITKYTEEDDYTVIAESDVIITTLGSGLGNR